MEYKPRKRRRHIKIPFGYYVSPFDVDLLIPDPKKLDALNYAFRMKLKHHTPIRSCTLWLHMAVGQTLTPAGFMYAYKAWLKRLQKASMKEAREKGQQMVKDYEEKYKDFGVTIDDRDNVAALAYNEAETKMANKEKKAAR